ncbi:DNA-processing protein DprA [Lacticaseibacillus brantae]|uniref:Rossmann nucleotide-binding protein for DNA uptake n=1 Tax=Lacticaseibacillus brantae DSM 23927 TaxID=1423727 RepID=A0A0R2B060_9LACO|nr:DNA-processing protein DprA [Lacticaseibacillus brantae]KRM72623.1 rossmann nucleotide-binding protein for DNA uptake [Lacticaseibacillus brantae DSM 23927]
MKLRDFLLAVHWLSHQSLATAKAMTFPPDNELVSWVQKQLAGQMAAFNQLKQQPFITIIDPSYPDRLKESFQPPLVLFYRGDWQLVHQTNLAVVGARQAGSYTKTSLANLVPGLDSMAIVSGLAQGADTMAHEAALTSKRPTIAVVAHGLDLVYPATNRELFNQIAKIGLVISEYPPTTPPEKFRFVARNRIIAGLAHGVLVTEAKAKSGSLITANYGLQNNREVFALPGPLSAPLAQGPNALIQAGAKMVLTAQDINEELHFYD